MTTQDSDRAGWARLVCRLLFSCFGVLTAWAAIELGLRVWSPLPAQGGQAEGEAGIVSIFEPDAAARLHWLTRLRRLEELPEGERPDGRVVNRFSARYGWINVANGSGSFRGKPVSFNSVGARGRREPGEGVAKDALRVVCYGESFTFGSEVSDAETWPEQLATRAAGRLDVLNLGVGGWGTDQALLRMRDTVDNLQPDIALLGVLSENISRNLNRLRGVYAPTSEPMVKPRFLLVESRLQLLPQPYSTELELLRAATDGSLGIDMAQREYWVPQPANKSQAEYLLLRKLRDQQRNNCWPLWRATKGEPYRLMLALIEAFSREARAAGVSFAGVVLFPIQQDLRDERYRLTALMQDLNERAIPYLDLYPLVQAQLAAGEPAYQNYHLTPQANAAIAVAVEAWLEPHLEGATVR